MTKCPYVPPHEFNVDFPHLMLRYRALENHQGKVGFGVRQITETDRNGRLAAPAASFANWATDAGNRLTRPALERIAGVHRDAYLPRFHGTTFVRGAKSSVPDVNEAAPAHGRKAVIYATCFVNYNNPSIGTATRAVLARNGVETEVAYPGCCAMPQLEHGDLERVAERARIVAADLGQWIEKGYDVIAPVPSCALMLKFEWPLILPEDEDVKRLGEATWDIAEYIVDIAAKEGLAAGLRPLGGGVTLHLACHARAQNMGPKAAEMLRLIPEADIEVIERCSGHGGAWGVMKKNFEVALKLGAPVARQAAGQAKTYLASECPLAGQHIVQGMARLDASAAGVDGAVHPIEILASAYGIASKDA